MYGMIKCQPHDIRMSDCMFFSQLFICFCYGVKKKRKEGEISCISTEQQTTTQF